MKITIRLLILFLVPFSFPGFITGQVLHRPLKKNTFNLSKKECFPLPKETDNSPWPIVYGGNLNTYGVDIDETYDGGYILSQNILNSGNTFRMGDIIKTDVNGNILWERRIGYTDNTLNYFYESEVTVDGGVIMIGSTTRIDQCNQEDCYDAWIMKLNACGNKEWCKIFSVPGSVEDGVDIVQLPGGNYVALINYFGYNVSVRPKAY